MNTVKGVIERIERRDCFNRVGVAARGIRFSVMTLELKDAFRENAPVVMLFKESDVVVAKGRRWLLSVENRFPCAVTKITAGDVWVELELLSSFGTVRSLIGLEACRRLKLACGERASAFIKASEISLMADV